MSLLPNVERELRRVANEPLSRPARRVPGWLLAAAVVTVAIVLGVGLLVTLGHRPGGSPGGSPVGGAFPGAPHSQGHWAVADPVCPLAPHDRYLPRRSGCVSVVRADVDGDGRPDLVLLYARLGDRPSPGTRAPVEYSALAHVLEVVRASGGVVRVRSAHVGYFNESLVRYGNVNGVPGDELLVEVERISSGAYYDVYSFRDGHLIRAKVTLQAGGDSADQQGFSCRPVIVQRVMSLDGPLPDGPWRWTVTTYAWHGAALQRVSRRSFVRHRRLSRAATMDGAGCGRLVAGGDR